MRTLILPQNVSEEAEEAVKVIDFYSVSPSSTRHFRVLTVVSEEVSLDSCFELLVELVIFHIMEHPFYLKELTFGCDSFPILKNFFDMISDDINDMTF